ncbi:MAG: CvpA family protein [Chloroflexota bacterium]
MGPNWFDVVIVIGMLWWLFAGFASGLVREVIGLGGLFAGLILAGRYSAALGDVFTPTLEPEIARIAAFVIIVFGVAFVAYWIGHVLHRLISLLFLGWVDHLLGGVFGLVKGVIIFTIVIAVLNNVPFMGVETAVKESILAPKFMVYIPLLLSLVPGVFDALYSVLQ